MLSRDQILKAFDRINVSSRGSERAPHKPLLVLYALGQLSRGHSNSIAFRDVAPKLTELLKEFGPTRQSYHPSIRSGVSRMMVCGWGGPCGLTRTPNGAD